MDKPCLDCKKRYVGCHSTCKDYLKSKEKTELIKKKRHEEGMYLDYVKTNAVKIRESKRRKHR